MFQNLASEAQLQPPGSITSHKPGDPTFTLVSVWAFLEFLSELLVIKNLSQCVYWKNSKDNLWTMGQLKQRQGKGKIDLLEGKIFLVGDLTVVKLL